MDIFVARQPILDRRGNLFAYELLFRSGLENKFDGTDPEQATARVISTSWSSMSLEDITGGKPAFINFTRDALVQGLAQTIPPERLVVEVLEDVEPDPEVIEALTELKKNGYRIALDDLFAYDAKLEPFLSLADIIKIDRIDCDEAACIALVDRCKELGLMMLAEKVEDDEQHQLAMDKGYRLFQGYFYQRPEIKTGKSIASNQASRFRILQALQADSLDLDNLEKLIKQDVALTYRMLRYINSSYFSWMEEVESIQRAFYYLGENNIRKWLSLAVIADLTEDRPTELITASLFRAFFMESACHAVCHEDQAGSAFMTGLLSLLPAILLIPMADIVNQLPLSRPIKNALTGVAEERLFHALELTQMVESGDWEAANRIASELGLPLNSLAQCSIEAIRQADTLLAL